MKFLAPILLSSAVIAADAFVECSEADPNCEKASRLGSVDAACVKREVVHIHNPFDPDYKNALAADPDLIPDKVVFRCVTVSQKDSLLKISGIEDEKTSVQAIYTYIEDENGTQVGSGASTLAASIMASISVLLYASI